MLRKRLEHNSNSNRFTPDIHDTRFVLPFSQTSTERSQFSSFVHKLMRDHLFPTMSPVYCSLKVSRCRSDSTSRPSNNLGIAPHDTCFFSLLYVFASVRGSFRNIHRLLKSSLSDCHPKANIFPSFESPYERHASCSLQRLICRKPSSLPPSQHRIIRMPQKR